MFSGIIEKTTKLLELQEEGTNKRFRFINVFPGEIYIDQSISHNGACLTVVSYDDETYEVVAIEETLQLTNLDELKIGDEVNLERSMRADSRMDGHMVQGHVDSTAVLKNIDQRDGSWIISLEIAEDKTNLVIPKGSIALNGISLTLKSVNSNIIELAIIPFTYDMTNIKNWKTGVIQ